MLLLVLCLTLKIRRRTDPDTTVAKAPVSNKAVEIGFDLERKPLASLDSHSELDLSDICLPGRDKSDSRIKKPTRPVRIRSILSVAVGNMKKQNTSLRNLPDPSETSLLSDTSTLVDVDGVISNKMEDIKEKTFLNRIADKANAVGDKFKKALPKKRFPSLSSSDTVDVTLCGPADSGSVASDLDMEGKAFHLEKEVAILTTLFSITKDHPWISTHF